MEDIEEDSSTDDLTLDCLNENIPSTITFPKTKPEDILLGRNIFTEFKPESFTFIVDYDDTKPYIEVSVYLTLECDGEGEDIVASYSILARSDVSMNSSVFYPRLYEFDYPTLVEDIYDRDLIEYSLKSMMEFFIQEVIVTGKYIYLGDYEESNICKKDGKYYFKFCEKPKLDMTTPLFVKVLIKFLRGVYITPKEYKLMKRQNKIQKILLDLNIQETNKPYKYLTEIDLEVFNKVMKLTKEELNEWLKMEGKELK